MHRFRLVTLASCVAMAIVSCAPQTTMLNSWTDPNYQAGSIKKKFNDPAFAAKVDRATIRIGCEHLGVSLDDHIANLIRFFASMD